MLQLTDNLYEHSQTINGLYNLVIENLCGQEPSNNKIHIHQLTLALLFGPVNRRDQKILNDCCLLIISLKDEVPANSLIER
jgi:hypothetical protein